MSCAGARSRLPGRGSAGRPPRSAVRRFHYSPYKVAENFHVLASLAPGRIDLGIGRAPGGLPLSTKALQQQPGASGSSLEEKLAELELFLHDELDPTHPLYGLKAVPIPDEPVGIYLLGTSVACAQLAAERGVPYVFALFINQGETVCQAAFGSNPTRNTRLK
ncbi:LLM class flavin-dependent oxidoreductase [Brevibacillus parabrevis]|uniref:LLM class flavin-dependent oxidoreductase n=1 Tax=Brevibacillus parabrevis TaxID=54914 RepID=UPI0028D72DBB|nr:LLM class flavin-dependent oxidoreductase [Brevibacillus parabrevis]